MPTWLDQPTATLSAAAAAVLIALANTGVTLWNSRRQNSRGAFRDLLTENVSELSDGLHQIIATSTILLKTRTPESHKAWCEKGSQAKEKLGECRSKLRYPLWGVTDSLNTLSRLPSWAAHAKRFPEAAASLVRSGDDLRQQIDEAVFYAIMKGRRPSSKICRNVRRSEKKLKAVYAEFRSTNFDAEQYDISNRSWFSSLLSTCRDFFDRG